MHTRARPDMANNAYMSLYLIEGASCGQNTNTSTLVSLTLANAVQMIAVRTGWNKTCHMHNSSASMILLKGEYYFKTHANKERIRMMPGAQMLLPQWTPHAEGNEWKHPTVLLVKW